MQETENEKSTEIVDECGRDAQKDENAKRKYVRWVTAHNWDFGDGREEKGTNAI